MACIWWLSSYPKSGNTWVRALLASLISGQPVDINDMSALGCPIASARSLIDDLLGIESADLTDAQQADLRPRAYEALAEWAEQPIYVKVHDLRGITPSGKPLFPRSITSGAVYIVRNPLDVAVSLAHFFGCSMAAAVDQLLKTDASLTERSAGSGHQVTQYLGDWASHIHSWIEAPFPVHVTRYEDLLNDPVAAFGEIVRFLGLEEEPTAILRTVRDCSFERLREQEQAVGFRSNSRSGNCFFRRGIIGAWRDELPPDQRERITQALGPAMRTLGY